MAASYPTSAKSFTTKVNGPGNTIDASHVNDLQAEVTAVETDLIAGLPVARGGTGNTSLTANRVLLGDGTSAIAVAGAGASGQVLTSNGASAPTFQAIPLVPTEQTTTATGDQDDFDLDARYTYLRCTGAAPVFSGFTVSGSAPSAGDTVIIDCLGTTAKVTTQDTGSTAANRIICPSTNGQIVGLNGRMVLVYDGTTDRWRESLIDPGTPIAVTFAAGDYTGNGSMTWTVEEADVAVDRYVQRGTDLGLLVTLNTTTVGGTPNSTLQKAIPGGFTANGDQFLSLHPGFDNNTADIVQPSVVNSGTVIRFRLNDASNWAAATNTTYVYLSLGAVVRVN